MGEFQRRQAVSPESEVDLTGAVDAFAERADQDPGSYRWSYTHALGGSRLVVVDSQAARRLDAGNRALLDDAELAWLDGQLTGDVEHLLVATSLPFLLPMGLHHLEAWEAAIAGGAWGKAFARLGERLRQQLDLEHWGALGSTFAKVVQMVSEVAIGGRGDAPSAVVFLSGDVHFSYATEVQRRPGSRILQLVCSPIRNPLPRALRAFAALAAHAARPLGALLTRTASVPDLSWRWRGIAGPWFSNNLAVLEIEAGELPCVRRGAHHRRRGAGGCGARGRRRVLPRGAAGGHRRRRRAASDRAGRRGPPSRGRHPARPRWPRHDRAH